VNDDRLKLKNQLCFPLYACSREIIKTYKPYLEKLDLTYTQYIVMMVLWEEKNITVKNLGECLRLDSGTLTPLLKKLESKAYVRRERSAEDERNLVVSITEAGENLKEKAREVPVKMGNCVDLSEAEAKLLYTLLYKVLDHLDKSK
jgi:MarR family transcriptional regulator, organic hydroperoxide resistance regulator